MSSRYIPLFDNAKLLCMLLVIIAHTLNNSYGHVGMELIRFYCLCFTMPLFTFISGYLSKPEVALRKNLKQLLIPCIIFTIINDLVCMAVDSEYVFTWKRPGFAMWYLWILFIYRTLLPKLLCIPGILPISFILSWIVGFLPWINADFQLQRIFCFLPWFLLGYKMAHINGDSNVLTYINKLGGVIWTILLIACFLFWTVVIIVHPGLTYATAFATPYNNHPFIEMLLRIALQLTIAVTGGGILHILPNRGTWYTRFGKRTMSAYLLHALIVLPMVYLVFPPFAIASAWQRVGMIVIPTICCLPLFSKMVDVILNRMLGLKHRKN